MNGKTKGKVKGKSKTEETQKEKKGITYMNEQKKLVLMAYKRLGILFVANMIILNGMSIEFLNAMDGDIVILLMMLLFIVFAFIVIPVVASLGCVIFCFVSGLERLEQGNWKSAIQKGKWCARLCMVPIAFIIFAVHFVGNIKPTHVVIIDCVCVALIIYDVYVIFLFRKIARCLKVAEIEGKREANAVENSGHEIEACEIGGHEIEVCEIGGHVTVASENSRYETVSWEIRGYETGSRENVYKDNNKTNVENGLDQQAYKNLRIIVWGSVIFIAMVVIVGWLYDMCSVSQVSVSDTIAYLLAMSIVIGLFVGGVEVCMFVFYRKGFKCLKDGDFHKARLYGVWNCVMSLYVYLFMLLATEVILELQGWGLKLVRCSYILFLVYQMYVILLFVKLRRSERLL